MQLRLFIVFLLLTATRVQAADSLKITLSASSFVKGDTLEMNCLLPYFKESKLGSATLNVWIEDLEKTNRWKFRYPIINGEVNAGLAISEKIPDGKYAVTFLVQRGFFRMTGKIKDHNKKDTSIMFMMVPKNNRQNTFFDITHVEPDGQFRLKSTLFADSAFFIFTSAKKTRSNDLAISIETSLDSVFTPVFSETRFITIGDPTILVKRKTDTTQYAFAMQEPGVTLLPGVTVTAKYKTKLGQYDEEYSSGMFKNGDAKVFDGLDNNDIANSSNVLLFLQGRIAGLTIQRNGEGQEVAKWRNETAEIYIDEFRVDPTEYNFIPTSEIAMIKVYRPPANLSASTGGAGAIAIYTKKGNFTSNSAIRHNFIVKGYTPVDAVWQ